MINLQKYISTPQNCIILVMSKKYLVLFVIVILLLPVNFGMGFLMGASSQKNKIQNLGPYYLPKEAVVSKVIDGDTIEITSPYTIGFGNDKVSYKEVRYLGVNSPDQGEKNFQEAKVANERLVSGKRISLEYDTPQNDKYGRILAWVWLDGKLISQEMLNTGYAVPFTMESQKLKYNLTLPPSR
jgi:endonuclease YncB( thermonuclease family)